MFNPDTDPLPDPVVLFDAERGTILVSAPRSAVRAVSERFAKSPAQAFALHDRLSEAVKRMVSLHVPEIAQLGCAPLPAGVETLDSYSVLTYYPFRGGCTVCRLHGACPGPDKTRGRV